MTEEEIKALAWDNLMSVLEYNGEYLSLREAQRIVGGRSRLCELLCTGRVVEVDGSTGERSKRLFPAWEIYRNARLFKKK